MATSRFTARNKARFQTLKGTQRAAGLRALWHRGISFREEADIFFQEEYAMKKFALLAAAAAFLAPALISSSSAETASVNIRVGNPGYRAYSQERVVVSPNHCRTTTVRTKRANGSVSIRKIRKCG
jgi:hypothetical protein